MLDYILVILEYMLRIILAGVCGALIGFERKNRGKEAGIRTHIIVAISSSLMMLVSKYGFFDLSFGEDFRLDPSRVASQIVSGVGFLGAGMIFIHKNAVKGLTTAAGVWATSGIGMAIGAGMYAVGIACSLVILFVHFITHRKWKFLQSHNEEQLLFSIENSDEAIEYLKNYLIEKEIHVVNMRIEKTNFGTLDVEITALLPDSFNSLNMLNFDRKYISSLNL